MKIQFKKLYPDAITPTYAHEGDAGLDLYTQFDFELKQSQRLIVPTGIAVDIPYGYVGLIHPKSGLAAKRNITVLNSPGTIDAGYHGELQVILYHAFSKGWVRKESFKKGDKIAQLVIQKVEYAELEEVTEFDDSSRGIGGFGSTGR